MSCMQLIRRPYRPLLAAMTIWLAFVPASWAGTYEDFFRGVSIDYPNVVQDLLKRGFDPNARNEQGQHALHVAIKEDSERVIALLLDLPSIDVDARNAVGETPLMMAAIRSNLPVMRKLLERGAQVQIDGWSPIHYAASQGELPVMELLLARGASLDARSPNGTTPLMMAARYGGQDVASLLLKRGADPRLKNDKGLDAADFARAAQRDRLLAEIERYAAKAAH